MSLIDQLINDGYLQTPEIIKAFKEIKRIDFIGAEGKQNSEIDSPLSIGYGQTISQPLTVVFMIELLKPKKGEKILDVGSGSGWTAALLAQIVGAEGRVYGLERICALKNFAEKNIAKYDFMKKGIVQIFCSDGYEGLPVYAPFDRIIVSASAEEIPQKLLSQLKIGGRMVIPIGKSFNGQSIIALDKINGDNFKRQEFPGFIFVPLVK